MDGTLLREWVIECSKILPALSHTGTSRAKIDSSAAWHVSAARDLLSAVTPTSAFDSGAGVNGAAARRSRCRGGCGGLVHRAVTGRHGSCARRAGEREQGFEGFAWAS